MAWGLFCLVYNVLYGSVEEARFLSESQTFPLSSHNEWMWFFFLHALSLISLAWLEPSLLFGRFSSTAQSSLLAYSHPQLRPGAPGEGGAGRPRVQTLARVLGHRKGHQVSGHLTRLHGNSHPDDALDVTALIQFIGSFALCFANSVKLVYMYVKKVSCSSGVNFILAARTPSRSYITRWPRAWSRWCKSCWPPSAWRCPETPTEPRPSTRPYSSTSQRSSNL